MPGTQILDAVKGPSKLIRPSDYHPLLLVHVGTNGTARRNPDGVNSDYRALGTVIKGFSFLPGRGRGVRRKALIVGISDWLRNWCWQQGLGLGHGTLLADLCLFGRDGALLTGWGRAISTTRMAGLIRRALS